MRYGPVRSWRVDPRPVECLEGQGTTRVSDFLSTACVHDLRDDSGPRRPSPRVGVRARHVRLAYYYSRNLEHDSICIDIDDVLHAGLKRRPYFPDKFVFSRRYYILTTLPFPL